MDLDFFSKNRVIHFRSVRFPLCLNGRKSRFSIEIPQTCEQMRDWCLGGAGLGSHFYCKHFQKINSKALYNYSASYWTSSFRFSFGKTRTHLFFVISAFADVSMTPKTNFKLWRHQLTPNKSRNFGVVFNNLIFWQYQNLGTPTFSKLWNRRVAKTLTIDLIHS